MRGTSSRGMAGAGDEEGGGGAGGEVEEGSTGGVLILPWPLVVAWQGMTLVVSVCLLLLVAVVVVLLQMAALLFTTPGLVAEGEEEVQSSPQLVS